MELLGTAFSTRSLRRLHDATIEGLLGEVFSVLSVPKLYNEKQLRLRESLETAVRIVGFSRDTVVGQ
jgi:hypothetical protein